MSAGGLYIQEPHFDNKKGKRKRKDQTRAKKSNKPSKTQFNLLVLVFSPSIRILRLLFLCSELILIVNLIVHFRISIPLTIHIDVHCASASTSDRLKSCCSTSNCCLISSSILGCIATSSLVTFTVPFFDELGVNKSTSVT